jgi:hypothetical protein
MARAPDLTMTGSLRVMTASLHPFLTMPAREDSADNNPLDRKNMMGVI